MKMRKHLVNLTIIMLLLLSLIVTPLQQIAFAEESNPNTPEEANEPAAPDAPMPPPILEFTINIT